MGTGVDEQPAGSTPTGGWTDADQVDWYLGRVGRLTPRLAGEAVLAELLPDDPTDLLDLGCGDGRLAGLVLRDRPGIGRVVAVDASPPMLQRARSGLGADPRVDVLEWDLNSPITGLGEFDVIVSGFAIHHLIDARKQELLSEVAAQLRPDGLFANLEVVRSATPELHAEFLAAIGRTADDPEDRLVDVETQLGWMRHAGLVQVDCIWRWRGFALLAGRGSPR